MKTYKCWYKSDALLTISPLMQTIFSANNLEDFEKALADGNISPGDINKELTYATSNHEKSDGSYRYYAYCEQPLYYAITCKKPFLISKLVEFGAKEDSSRLLLHHAFENLDITGIETVKQAGFNTLDYNALLTNNHNKFEYAHKHCFNRTFDQAIADKNRSSDANTAYLRSLTDLDIKHVTKLKEKFLNIIMKSPENKDALKEQWLLGIDHPIMRFLRTRKKHHDDKKPAKSFTKLAAMLRDHKLTETKLDNIREALTQNLSTEGFTPNPALAALYFANRAADNEDDYTLFGKHLMCNSITGYTQGFEQTLKSMLSKDKLSVSELTTLKKNILEILKFKPELRETLNLNVFSPLRLIVRTGKDSRKEKDTHTFFALQTQGLFKKASNPAPDPQVTYKADVAYMEESNKK